jgi:hypothetical protein
MSERTWPVAEDPDEDADWGVDFDDDGVGAADKETGGPLVVFVHIQKTAGKTLRQILRRQYAGPGRSVHVPNFFAKPELHWSTVDELVKRRPPGLAVAHGHMLFVPDRWPRDARYVTFLRDPVERTISHYYWLNERRGARSGLGSIEEAIGQGAIRDNLQVRVFAGADPSDPVTSTMAEEAIAALDRFTVVGLTSRFDETLVLFGRTFGWRTAAYERVNSTNSRVPRDALDAATLERIEEHNRYDQALYAVAAARFDELMRAQPDDFQLEVDIVRAAVARTPLDAPWPEQSTVLSTDGMDARALLVSSEASRLAAELDRQRLLAATRQIARLQSELQSKARVPGGDVDQNVDEELRAATARIDELETAQHGAKQKIARARKRLANTGPLPPVNAPDASVEAPGEAKRSRQTSRAKAVRSPRGIADAKATATMNRTKRPRDPNVARKPKAPRDSNVERKPKVPRAKRPKTTRAT